MPNRSKQKGNRGEYELRDVLRRCGFVACRVPQSGSSPDMPGDLLVESPRDSVCSVWSVKRRRRGPWQQIYKWLGETGVDVLAFRDDGRKPGAAAPPWVVCMEVTELLRLVRGKDN